jgi:hypothetical protein
LLVKNIRDKGYKVKIGQGYLIIFKKTQDDICNVGWAISKYDLCPDMEEWLYHDADRRMDMIDKAIAERYGDAPANVAKE